MKFLALFTKDIMSVRIWMLIVFVVLGILLMLEAESLSANCDYDWANQTRMTPQKEISYIHESSFQTEDREADIMYIWFSFGMAAILGFWHFWMPKLKGTQAFHLYRPCSRELVLSARLLSGIVSLAISVLLPWTLYFMYYKTASQFSVRPQVEAYYQSLGYFAASMALYFTVALMALTSLRWIQKASAGLFMLVVGALLLSTNVLSLPVFMVVSISIAVIMALVLSKNFLTAEF